MYDEADKTQSTFEARTEDYILKTISAGELIAAIRGQRTNSKVRKVWPRVFRMIEVHQSIWRNENSV